MNNQQRNLIRRVESLRCLPRFQKIVVARIIQQIDDTAALQDYDQHGLGFVEQYIEPLTHSSPPFARLCEQFSDGVNPAELATALGVRVPQEFEPDTWFEWACALEQTPITCLCCLGNFWILPIFDHQNSQFTGMVLPIVMQCVSHLGQHELAVHAAESVLNINPRDFELRQQLTDKLHAHADSNDSNLIAMLADSLRFIPGREASHAVRLLEAWLGVAESDYESVATLARALEGAWERKQLFSGRNQSSLIVVLADALRFIPGREARHAARLLEAWLGVDETDYESVANLAAALDQAWERKQLFDGPNQSNLVDSLADALRLVPDREARHAARLLEAWLGVKETDYESVSTLARALETAWERKQLFASPNQSGLVIVLANSLQLVHGREARHAARLLEAWLGVAETDYESVSTLARALEAAWERKQLFVKFNQSSLIRSLADALRFVPGREARHAVQLLEAWLGVAETDYKSVLQLAVVLETAWERKQLFDGNNQSSFICSLAGALRFVPGREVRHATRLLEAWIQVPPWDFARSPKFTGLAIGVHLSWVQTWLDAADVSSDAAFQTCEAVHRLIVETRAFYGSAQQRGDFLHRIGAIRRNLMAVGLRQAEHAREIGNETLATEREQRMLTWLEAIENRTTLEQMLGWIGRVPHDGANLVDEETLRRWPFTDSHWKRDRLFTNWSATWSRLHGKAGRTNDDPVQFPQSLSLPLEARPEVSAMTDDEVTFVERQLTAQEQRLHQELHNLAAHEPELETLLPDQAVFVRTLFAKDGTLHWWGLRRDGKVVSVLARGSSAPGADQRLQQALLRFDHRLEQAWSQVRHTANEPILSLEEYAILQALAAPEAHHESSNRDQFVFAVFHILERLAAEHRLTALRDLGRALLKGVIENVEVDDVWKATWHESLAALQEVWPAEGREQRRRAELNAISRRYVAEIERELDLDPLWKSAAGKFAWEQTDLLYQTQGSLWAAPLAYLPFGDRPLFEQVASVGAVTSLTLRRLSETELAHHRAVERRLLSAYWMEHEERQQAEGLGGLHLLLETLCNEQPDRDAPHSDEPWEFLSLADTPTANRRTVRVELSSPQRKLAAAVVAAHGSLQQGGVLLADQVWNGALAELGSIDFLILIACAVGRLGQGGGRDVEGLYTRLAAHNCRCVLAARYPIADREAALFAAVLLEEYRKLLRASDYISSSFLRARAFNNTRRRLAQHPDHVTEHLVQAFEIFGLG